MKGKQGFQKGNRFGKKFQKGYIPWSKGKKLPSLSENHKARLRKVLKGRKSPNIGKRLSYVTERNLNNNPMKNINSRLKMCLSKKGGVPWNKGIGIPKPLYYQIRNSVKYYQWRSDIYSRDNWTCQTCQERGCKIEAHHKKDFVQIIKDNNIKTLEEALNCLELWDLNNGVTLCLDCHRLTRRKQ